MSLPFDARGDATCGFIGRHGLWSEEQWWAADEVGRLIDEHGIATVRVAFPDQHGILRGKTLTREGLASALRAGSTAPSSLVLKDTAGRTAYPIFRPGAGLGQTRLEGAGDLIGVPDPTTFRILPWAPRTGWLLCDLYFPDGSPVPYSTRNLLRQQLDGLAARGYALTVGLELEFHVFRAVPGAAAAAGADGPPAAPAVALLGPGFELLADDRLDVYDEVVQLLNDGLRALNLPLRSIELEFGPSQLEVTFAPAPALRAADDMVLARSAIRQICARHGYHATFMCRPHVEGVMSSGWHLHQSLTALDDGANAFAGAAAGEVLSELGRHYLAGILEHAAAASVFTTPTVNGYKRYRPHSLAPDRIVWGVDNKGAMARVVGGGAGDPATRIENRAGEPAANPYLSIAAQLVSGLDGIDRRLDPGPPTADPYGADARRLPVSLIAALAALRADPVFADALGGEVVDWICTLKDAEVARYLAAVTDWEQREYFSTF